MASRSFPITRYLQFACGTEMTFRMAERLDYLCAFSPAKRSLVVDLACTRKDASTSGKSRPPASAVR